MPLTAALVASATAAVLALTAPTERGDEQPHIRASAATNSAALATQLDPNVAQQVDAEAAADRFADRFAAYLAGTRTGLQSSGASHDLVRRIRSTTSRSSTGSSSSPLRAGGVAVRADGGGWIATTTLSTRADRQGVDAGAPRIVLTFRLERRAQRVVVVDVNTGGQE